MINLNGDSKMKILVLGISGMLGNGIFRKLSTFKDCKVYGTLRSASNLPAFKNDLHKNIITEVDVENFYSLIDLFSKIKPDVVINCIGLVKQIEDSGNILRALPINSLLPHRLAKMLSLSGTRFIHISTDCVFSGTKGMYKETDIPDAIDIYGLTKLMGEVTYENTVTLRTSIIGHEIKTNRSLVNWFLAQEGVVKGFSRAIFSGLPTVELAEIIHRYIIPNKNLTGLYHISANPIDKFSLLKIIAKVYKKNITIEEDKTFVIDRSLDSSRFRDLTGFCPSSWDNLIVSMHNFS
jgi:dTDP-4-dehydrorhamnose reductase